MTLPAKALPHTCTLRARKQTFTLAYDTLTAAFTVGKTLTGTTSHATAIIVGIPGTIVTDPQTGTTLYTVPANTLLLHTINGTFANDEPIADNGTVPGAALVNGTIAEAFDVNQSVIYSDVDTSTACNIYKKLTKVQISGQSTYIETGVRIMLPATVTPVQGDLVVTTQAGFTGTWTLGSPDPKKGPGLAGAIGHWEADLAKGGA